MDTQEERTSIIVSARGMIGMGTQLEDHAASSRFDGVGDKLLAAALDVFVSEGMADEETGDVDSFGHFTRVGAFIVVTDSQGFVDFDQYATPSEAERRIDVAGKVF